MFVFGNLIIALTKILSLFLEAAYWLILIRALISWVNPDPYNPIVQFLQRVTEPILRPIRQRLPYMAFDFSPIIAFLIIMFLKSFLVETLMEIGYRMH